MKPIIGVTTFLAEKTKYSSVSRAYIDSIYAAGGIPVTIPIIQDATDYTRYIELLDGILFTGGNDIAPYFYGENPIKEVQSISSIRDEYEFHLFKLAYEKKIPIFGICRGIQLINVALGGTLYQDINQQIPGTLGHFPEHTPTDEYYHTVRIQKGSRLHKMFAAEEIYTNSFHHQSIKQLGNHLKGISYSEDQIVEAVEGTQDQYVLGVQWHPECMTKRHPIQLKLFFDFVEASLLYKAKK